MSRVLAFGFSGSMYVLCNQCSVGRRDQMVPLRKFHPRHAKTCSDCGFVVQPSRPEEKASSPRPSGR